jgi:NAD+ kinase
MTSTEVRRIAVIARRKYPEIQELGKHFDIVDKGDLCVAIGGDGTFLKAARSYDCPILLVRSGEQNSLGFHADTSLQQLPTVIEKLKKGDYYIEKHRKLRVSYQDSCFEAVNDAVLFRANLDVIHFKVNYFDDKGRVESLYPGIVRGDGIIIARQIGSTAYNYFAHGPIILSGDVSVVTPITANYRFSVVSDHDFSVELLKNSGFLNYDGVEIGKLEEGNTFNVSRSDKSIKIVRFGWAERFSEKLARLSHF